MSGPLSVAQQLWHALGENTLNTIINNARPVTEDLFLTKENYNFVAKHAFQDPSASVKEIQYAAINHASSKENL